MVERNVTLAGVRDRTLKLVSICTEVIGSIMLLEDRKR